MVLRKGKVVEKFRFNITGTAIPTISEKPVKSLGKVFDSSLRDTTSIPSTCTELDGWLKSVDKYGLPGKFKAWIYQQAILPRMIWPLLVHAVPISTVETLERRVTSYLRRWFGYRGACTASYSTGTQINCNCPSNPWRRSLRLQEPEKRFRTGTHVIQRWLNWDPSEDWKEVEGRGRSSRGLGKDASKEHGGSGHTWQNWARLLSNSPNEQQREGRAPPCSGGGESCSGRKKNR
jgi:hypothetical protein